MNNLKSKKLGGNFKIFEKNYGEYCDYFRVYLSLPIFFLGKYVDSWHDENFNFSLRFENNISFTKSDAHWSLTFIILGFGFSLSRQWDF